MHPGRLFLIVTLAAAATACGARADGPPAIEVDRTACSHCGMLVSERAYAAAYRSAGGEPRVFDDIKCLLDAVAREPEMDRLQFWFHDAASAAWIGGSEAVFVTSPQLRTPMGGGAIAFRDRAAALDWAARNGGTLVESLQALESRIGGAGRHAQ